jgi:RecA-family ATPase
MSFQTPSAEIHYDSFQEEALSLPPAQNNLGADIGAAVLAEADSLLGDADFEDGSPKIGFTFGELLNRQIVPREEIIRGLARKENGLIQSVTNGCKTTITRNLTINLILGKPFPPFSVTNKKYRVAIIDSEDSLAFLRSDLLKMMEILHPEERELIKNNLFLLCEVFEFEDLNLNDLRHQDQVLDALKRFKPDLTIVDTISKCFSVRNENDNAEVKERVMKPLHKIARITDSAILAAHHIGKAKSEDGSIKEAAHRGRGASGMCDLSRVIYNIDKDEIKNRYVLSCAKIKGQSFDDTIYVLDPETRWLTSHGERSEIKGVYEQILDVFEDGLKYKAGEIKKKFEGKASERTIANCLKRGIDEGELLHPDSRQGVYQKANVFD